MRAIQHFCAMLRRTSGAFAVMVTIGSSPAEAAYTGEEFAKDTKVTLEQARKVALLARGGKVIAQELEKEPGGSGLRYSFDIRRGKITYEVGVDAVTGKVLENKAEGPHPD
jgi:uncharacterized membrane protein YkoI